jgi:hypothetical protein
MVDSCGFTRRGNLLGRDPQFGLSLREEIMVLMAIDCEN